MPHGILLLNEEGYPSYVNPAAEEILPFNAGTSDRPFSEMFPDTSFRKAEKEVLGGAPFFRGEVVLSDPDRETEKNCRWSLVPARKREEDKKVLLCILEDITEEQVIQRQLLESARMASVGELAAGTAHNLRSPLGAVKGILELLTDELETGNIMVYSGDSANSQPTETVKDQIQIVLKSLDIDDLLEFARKPDRPVEIIRLDELLEEAKSLMEDLFKERGIKIGKKLEVNHIMGRKADLLQVFLNLYSNAYKAMPQGGKLMTQSCMITRQQGKFPLMEIRVSDTGCGIPPKHIPKIYDPFFTTSEQVQGTGLGLSLTHKIIKEHGGTIEVSSQEGEGSVFILTFPIHPRPDMDEWNKRS